jgi:hypothetical protein
VLRFTGGTGQSYKGSYSLIGPVGRVRSAQLGDVGQGRCIGSELFDDTEGPTGLEHDRADVSDAVDAMSPDGGANVGLRHTLTAHGIVKEFPVLEQRRRLRIDDDPQIAPVCHQECDDELPTKD